MRHNTEDVYKRIYTKTLERKNQLSKINNLRSDVFLASQIETDSYLDFSISRKNLLPSGSTVVYLYEDVLSDKTLIDGKSITPRTVYGLVDFNTRTKVGILIHDETGLIDPNLINVYVTDMNTVVFMISKNTSIYISVIYLKGIYGYARYNNNVDVPIPAAYKNSFVVWTKLDNSPSGAIDWINPVLTNGQYTIPIRAQGKFSVLMLSDNFRFYNIVPQTNSQFSYINFPDEIGYTDLDNIFLWKNRNIGFSQPIAHTPLHDGFKVEGVTRTSVKLDGSTGYASFGTYPAYTEVTIHLKLKISAFEDWDRVLHRGNSDGNGWNLRLTASNKLIFQFKKYSLSMNVTSGVLSTNTWYDVSITAKSGMVPQMFINSILQPAAFIDDEAGDSGTSDLVLGRRANDNSYNSAVEVDFLRIYNRVLDFSEILNAYNQIPTDTGMVNQWLMNENTGTTLTDSKGTNNGTLFGGYTWLNGPDDTAGRLVGFSKRFDYMTKYTDLLSQYGKYQDYMGQYLNNTLPTTIKNFAPYVPNVTMDTLITDFQDKMVTASKDYPNFLKEYLEENKSINFTEYNVFNDVNPVFARASQATSVDGKYILSGNDTPRYVTNTDPLKKGIIIEEAVTNMNPDPLFLNPVVFSGTYSSTAWTMGSSTQNQQSVSVSNGVLRHTALGLTTGADIRLIAPSIVINKTLPLTVQFKIKYIKNDGTHTLFAAGTATDTMPGSQVNLQQYMTTTYTDSDGFIYREYRIPANLFTGSGTSLSLSLRGDWSTYQEKDYFIKEFQVINKTYGGHSFTTVAKTEDKLTIPSANVLNPLVGSVEIWFTPETISTAYNSRLVQSNDTSLNTRFLMTVMTDGSVYFSGGTSEVSNRVMQSLPGLITPRNTHYVVMTWENGVLYAYVNGVLINSGNYGSAGAPLVIKDFFYIGSDFMGAQQLNGIVNDFRVSNIKRTGTEILANYNAKTSLAIDANTTMKMNFDGTIKTPNALMHPVKVVTNHNLKKRLTFINGINISPASCTYDIPTRKWTSLFRSNDIRGTKLVEVDTGGMRAPYWEGATNITATVNIGPNTKIDSNFEFDVYELVTPADSLGTISIMDPSNYTYTINENTITFTFLPAKVGANIYVVERRFNQFIPEGYSYDGLLQKLPTWVGFLPKEKIFLFLNGRLLEKERFYLFDAFRYQVLKGDTVIATDLDTNTIDGEIFNGYYTSELELVDYNIALVDGTKVITTNNKDFPFSKKYCLVFVDGKLIHPDDIKEIDNYRFSMTTTSTNNMCILRKRMDFTNKQKFSGIKDTWTQYLESLTQTNLEALIGTLNTVHTGENNSRSVFLTERHLFEVLYYYCLQGRTSLDPNDDTRIPIELPGTMLQDGRIPISTMRSGPYPRYAL